MKHSYVPLLVAAGVGVAIGSVVTGSVVSVLPLLLLLACPLMMIFMMASMGWMHHGSGRDERAAPDRDREDRLT